MASDTAIPKVTETDIDRDDLNQAASELGIEDHESLEDQELFEEVGRRLGKIDDTEHGSAQESSETDASRGAAEDTTPDGDEEPESMQERIRSELQEMTRDQVRDELRELGLPVSGSKDELVQRLEAVRVGQAQASNGQGAADHAEGAAKDAAGQAEDAADQAKDTAEQGRETAEDSAEQAQDTAEQAQDTAEDTAEQAQDTAEDTAEPAREAADEVTEDRKQARDRGEYRVEDDQRDDIKPILDLELGPLALDVLGLDVHLNRVHAVLTANPGPKHAVLGKLLSGVASVTDKAGLNGAVGKVTNGIESAVGALPTPDTGIGDDEDDEDDEDDGGGGGLLSRLGSTVAGAARAAKHAVGHGTDAAGSAKDATKDAVTSGGNAQAAKEGKDALGSAKDAATSAKNVATGGE